MWDTYYKHYNNRHTKAKLSDFGPKWIWLAPNGTNPGLFQIRFQCIWRPRAKCTEIWSEKAPDLSHLGPIWHTLEPNLPSLPSTRINGCSMLECKYYVISDQRKTLILTYVKYAELGFIRLNLHGEGKRALFLLYGLRAIFMSFSSGNN